MIVVLMLAVLGCGSPGERGPKSASGPGASAPSTSPSATLAPSSTGASGSTTGGGTFTGSSTTGSSTGGSSTTTGSATTPTDPEPVVRFVVLGDAGEGNADQFQVAEAMQEVCDRQGCDFALYLGDNFYDSGVDSVSDSQWETKFEQPYAHLEFPFYPVLGNHDLGLEGLGVEFWLQSIYVDYTSYSTKWTMPAPHYAFEVGHLKFLALDTTKIFFSFSDEQEAFVENELANLSPGIEHVIAFGHHPYVSNGQHGNAGNYEGLGSWIPLAEIPRGDYVRDFFDDHICGKVLVYFSGHDHNRQWMRPTCGTEFIVSGAGAKTSDLVGRGNSTFFEDDAEEGFMWVEIEGSVFTGQFYNRLGVLDYEQSFTL